MVGSIGARAALRYGFRDSFVSSQRQAGAVHPAAREEASAHAEVSVSRRREADGIEHAASEAGRKAEAISPGVGNLQSWNRKTGLTALSERIGCWQIGLNGPDGRDARSHMGDVGGLFQSEKGGWHDEHEP